MGRFNINKYDPANDSSTDPSSQKASRETGCVVLRLAKNHQRLGCPCGCGEMPKGKHATFAMGHDARLRGKLIRAHLTGTQIILAVPADDLTIRRHKPTTAMRMASEHGWEDALLDAERRREGKNLQVLQRALGSKRLVRVGRWEYTGQVVAVYTGSEHNGETYDIEYVTKQGDVKQLKGVSPEKAPVVA